MKILIYVGYKNHQSS
jgi:hypothetical protein